MKRRFIVPNEMRVPAQPITTRMEAPQQSSRERSQQDSNYGSSTILTSQGVGVLNFQTLAEVWSPDPAGQDWRVRFQNVDGFFSPTELAMRLQWGSGGVQHELNTVVGTNFFAFQGQGTVAFNLTAQWVRLSLSLNALAGTSRRIQGSISSDGISGSDPLVLSLAKTVVAGGSDTFLVPQWASKVLVTPFANAGAGYPFDVVTQNWWLTYSALGAGEKMEWTPFVALPVVSAGVINIRNGGLSDVVYNAHYKLEL